MKIGIVTYHRSYNYGAFLQALSLCKRLNMEDDIQAEIVDYNMPVSMHGYHMSNWSFLKKVYRYKKYCFQKQLGNSFEENIRDNKALLSDSYVYSDKIEDFINAVKGKYDVLIAGSDEIWRLDSERGFPSPYWLPGELGCIKCSYAASSRSSLDILDDEKKKSLKSLIEDFSVVSVRDLLTYELLKDICPSKEIHINCDPSFLYDYGIDKDNAKASIRKIVKNDKPNIVIMCEDEDCVNEIKVLNNKYNLLSVYKYHTGMYNLPKLKPVDWLGIISGADCVISSFYHGICYSIINHTPFIALGTEKKKSKLEDLLLNTKLDYRYLTKKNMNYNQITNLIKSSIDEDVFTLFVKNQSTGFNEYVSSLRSIVEKRGKIE